MTALATPMVEDHRRRFLVFRMVAAMAGAFLLACGLAGLLAPWPDLASFSSFESTTGHGWHHAQRGALLGILLAGNVLALVWRPWAHVLLLRFLALAAVLLAALGGAFDPQAQAVFVLPIVLCVATYPNAHRLFTFARPARPSMVLLALSAALAAALVPDAWHSLHLQLRAADLHAAQGYWIVSPMLATTLALAGGLSATRRPGWQALGALSGATLIYLGLAATVAPDQAGSWAGFGGGLATVGGWGFVAATWWEARRSCKISPAADVQTDLPR
jgi:hypothetical protein